MSQKKSIAMILAVTALVLLSYQNCGVEAPQSMYDAFQVYKLPYESKIDQIAYMSCSEQQNVPNQSGVFFTLRAGAYGEEAGLKLSQNFLEETKRDQNDERALKLAEEFSSLNYRVQFSIREQSNLFSMYLNGGSSQGVEAQDFDFVFGDLGSNPMSASLVSLGENQYMNYWAAGGISLDAYMQGTLVYNSAETVAEQLRTFLSQEGLLTVAYAQPVDPGLLLTRTAYNSPDQDDDGDGREDDSDDDVVPSNEAYGTGFRLNFKKPLPTNWGYTGSPHLNLPRRVLDSVVEYDLTNPSAIKPSTWQCPSTLQLRVVHPDHRNLADPIPTATGRTLCPAAADPTSAADLANFQIVRRSLPISDWDINWARKCVVPKISVKGSCYGINTSVNPTVTRSPRTNITLDCDPAISPNTCLHFVSICLRP